jgi:hypothetical protein
MIKNFKILLDILAQEEIEFMKCITDEMYEWRYKYPYAHIVYQEGIAMPDFENEMYPTRCLAASGVELLEKARREYWDTNAYEPMKVLSVLFDLMTSSEQHDFIWMRSNDTWYACRYISRQILQAFGQPLKSSVTADEFVMFLETMGFEIDKTIERAE